MSSDAKRAANARYLKSMKTLAVRVKPGRAEEIAAAAQAAGQSVQAFILQSVHDTMNSTLKPTSTVNGIELDAAALAEAQKAAEAAGETVDVFLARAIHDTKQRDEITRQLKR